MTAFGIVVVHPVCAPPRFRFALLVCASKCTIGSWDVTYTSELGAAVTALGSSSSLLDVEDTGLTTGRLDDTGPVRGGVVAGGGKSLLSVCGSCQFESPTGIVGVRGFSPVTASVSHSSAGHFC